MTGIRNEAMDLSDTRLLLNRLRFSVHSDGGNPKSFALLLGKAAESKPPAWELEGFASFAAYVTAPATDGGLGMTDAQVKAVASLAGERTASLVQGLLDELPLARNGDIGGGHSSFDIIKAAIGGTSESYLRRRLKRDRPDLYEMVDRGEIKPSAAAVEAGMRHRTLSVRADDAEAAFRTLSGTGRSKRKGEGMSREQLAELAKLIEDHLKEGGPDGT